MDAKWWQYLPSLMWAKRENTLFGTLGTSYFWVRSYFTDSHDIIKIVLEVRFDAYIYKTIKDWSQFLIGSWRNNLNQVVHTV